MSLELGEKSEKRVRRSCQYTGVSGEEKRGKSSEKEWGNEELLNRVISAGNEVIAVGPLQIIWLFGFCT